MIVYDSLLQVCFFIIVNGNSFISKTVYEKENKNTHQKRLPHTFTDVSRVVRVLIARLVAYFDYYR